MTRVTSTNRTTITTTDTQTLVASNATATVPIFRISGSVQVIRLYGVVTTALGSNVTAAYWRFNDQTAQTNITLNTGATLSSAVAGSVLAKITTNGSALTLLNSSAGRVSETTANHVSYQEFQLVAKSGANSDIEFVYSTTNTPTSGVIQFMLEYKPLSLDCAVTPL